MRLSPLQLDKHFFTKVNIEASQQEESSPNIEFGSRVMINQHIENERNFLVKLNLFSNDEEEENPNYTFNVEVVGVFTINDDYPSEKIQKLVEINAPAVLFGAAREMISNITSRGPLASFDLPTVAFIPEKNDESSEEEN